MALQIEELKFYDVVKEVVDVMIDLKNTDEAKRQKSRKYIKHVRQTKKKAVFNNLLESAFNQVQLRLPTDDEGEEIYSINEKLKRASIR